MEKETGTFVALEGVDGSVRDVQFKLLAERLKAVGYEVEVFEFPRSGQTSSRFVEQYLKGRYGPARQISPYAVSLFYALDRFEASPAIRQAIDGGKVVLTSGYAGSNMAHQGAMFKNAAEQRGFFVWADSLEFHLLGTPRPDINIFLHQAAEISYQMTGRKPKSDYTKMSSGERRSEVKRLNKAVGAYESLCELFPKDFSRIDCSAKGQLLDIATVNDRIWAAIQPLLPKKRTRVARSVTVDLTARPAARPPAPKEPAGAQNLDELELALSPMSLYALSLIDETDGLQVERVKTPAAEPAYAPLRLPRAEGKLYRQTIERILDIRRRIAAELRAQSSRQNHDQPDDDIILETLLPMSTLVRSHIKGPRKAFEKLLSTLDSWALDELTAVDGPLRRSLGKSRLPAPPRTKDKGTDRGQPEPLQTTIIRLAQNRLSPNLSTNLEPVQLLNYWPKNEFELLADGLYPHTSLSHAEIAAEVADWPYEQKVRALRAIIKQSDKVGLQAVRYHWDIICDQLTRRELINQGLASDIQTQIPTIRYGYALPSLVEQLKLEDLYLEAYDLSNGLFSQLQAVRRGNQAPYTSLQGHRARLQFTTGLADLTRFLSAAGDRPLEILVQMAEKIREVHPITSAIMSPAATPHSGNRRDNSLAKADAR